MTLFSQKNPNVLQGVYGERPSAASYPSSGDLWHTKQTTDLWILENDDGVRSWVQIGGEGSLSILSNPVFYVDPGSGSDNNAGTLAEPFATLNHVLQVVTPGYYGFLTINLRAGISTIGSKTVFPRPLGNTNTTAGGILINGVDNADSGLGARTSAGGAAGTQATFGTVIDSVGGLVVNAHRGQFLRFTSGASLNNRVYLIEGNTATTFTVEGSIAVAPTVETFVVETPAAVISWVGTQVLQGQGGTVGFQNVILNGPGGANLLQTYNLTMGLQKVQLTNLGSFGITLGEHSSLVNLTALTNQLGTLSIPQQCGSYFNFNATISPLSTARMSVSRSLFQDVRIDMQQLSMFQALDSTFRGNSWVRANYGGLISLDRFHFDTVTPAPVSNAFFGAAGAAVVLSKGSKGTVIHGDISNTPATTAPGDAVLVEDGSVAQFASLTGSGNAGVGGRLVRGSSVVMDQSGTGVTVTGTANQKVGQNAAAPWPVTSTQTDPVELCVLVGL